LTNTTLVPTAAVQHNGTAAFVYIVNANKTVGVQPITTVTNNDTVTAVTGVSTGVTLATSGFDRLDNGVPVQVQVHQGKGASGSTGATSGGNTTP
jgi:multidrug efflux system membrane fusion protein